MVVFLIGALKIIFLLGFLVLIHEGGHFLVAKWSKVKVLEFAIGFGPTIWKKQGKETKYALRLIPLGGFCNMEGEEERSENDGSFSKASIPKRIVIVAAGGFVNIIFGLLVYFILTCSQGEFITTKIETIMPNYAISQTSIMEGDEIVKINGKTVNLKSDMDEMVQKSNGNSLKVTVKRDNKYIEYEVIPTAIPTKNLGIYLSSTEGTAEIVAVTPKSQSEGKLEAKDEIISINGIDVQKDANKVIEIINTTNEEDLVFNINRKGENIEVIVTPEIINTYVLGIQLQKAPNDLPNNLYYGMIDTGDFIFSIIDNLKMLFTGNVSVDQLMGPVGIAEAVTQTNSMVNYIYLFALISLSLGVTNLLPFPPLDGGKIVILIIEAIRKKPLPEKTEITIQMLGFALLIGLSIFVTYNDILRIF